MPLTSSAVPGLSGLPVAMPERVIAVTSRPVPGRLAVTMPIQPTARWHRPSATGAGKGGRSRRARA